MSNTVIKTSVRANLGSGFESFVANLDAGNAACRLSPEGSFNTTSAAGGFSGGLTSTPVGRIPTNVPYTRSDIPVIAGVGWDSAVEAMTNTAEPMIYAEDNAAPILLSGGKWYAWPTEVASGGSNIKATINQGTGLDVYIYRDGALYTHELGMNAGEKVVDTTTPDGESATTQYLVVHNPNATQTVSMYFWSDIADDSWTTVERAIGSPRNRAFGDYNFPGNWDIEPNSYLAYKLSSDAFLANEGFIGYTLSQGSNIKIMVYGYDGSTATLLATDYANATAPVSGSVTQGQITTPEGYIVIQNLSGSTQTVMLQE